MSDALHPNQSLTSQGENPFQSAAASSAPAPRRPGWLTAVCVVGIVLGALCILQVIGGLAAMAFQSQVQEWSVKMQSMSNPAMTPELKKVYEEMNDEIGKVQAKWRNVLLGLNGCLAVLGGLFLFGSVKSLSLAAIGRKVLLAAFALTVVYELSLLWPQIAIQSESTDISMKFTSRIMDLTMQQQAKGKPIPPQVKEIMTLGTTVGIAVVVVMMGGWTLIKMIGYGLAIWYLTRPQVRALFANVEGAATVAPI